MSTLNSQDNFSGLLDQSIPQWKRELILKRRALGRTLQAGNVYMKLTCPTTSMNSCNAAVGRNDESLGTGVCVAETTSGKQQRCTSSVATVVPNKSSLDQNEADFHPGSSSSSVGSVLNMRLVEVEVEQRLEGKNDLVYGGANKVMFDNYCAYKCVVSGNKMGEEKSIIIKRPNSCSVKPVTDNKYIVKRKHRPPTVRSVSENKVAEDEDCQSDSSEELKYGPGIVNKLKTKYLSMTLRENQKRGVRPSLSNLRRATSLENMLEDDGKTQSNVNVSSPTTVNSNNIFKNKFGSSNDRNNSSRITNRSAVVSYPYNYAKNNYGRRNVDNIMKRACSMDTLLHSDIQPDKSVMLRLNKTGIHDKDISVNCKKNIASIANEDLIIVENSSKENHGILKSNSKESKIAALQQRTRGIKTSISVEEKELPPPDVVKQTLKKFESVPKSKPTIQNKTKIINTSTQNSKPVRTMVRANLSGTNNVSSVNDKQYNSLNKPVLSPKPTIINSPEKRLLNRAPKPVSPKRNIKTLSMTNVENNDPSQLQKSIVSKSNSVTNMSIESANKSKEVIKQVTATADNEICDIKRPQPTSSPCVNNINNVCNNKPPVVNSLSENVVESDLSSAIPSNKLSKNIIHSAETKSLTVNENKISSSSCGNSVNSPVASPISVPEEEEEEESDDVFNVQDVPCKAASKSVSPIALENIRKGGTSLKFNFKSDNKDNPVKKSYLPVCKEQIPAQATNTALLASQITPLLVANSVNVLTTTVKTQDVNQLGGTGTIQTHMKQVGVIRPIISAVANKTQPAIATSTPIKTSSSLTDLEIEKNLINSVKSIEQPVSKVVVAIKTLPDSVLLGSVQTDLSANKNIPKMSNSEIKNRGLWSDKKPWHQSQNTMVFNFSDRKDVPDYIENDGLILRGKRDRPRPGEGGFIFLGGSGNRQESSTDDVDDDSEDSALGDPPSPCDVCFVNDNILINGKSNLLKKPKQQKLRIQFKEEATTFEYPSESSFCDQMSVTDSVEDDRLQSSASPQPSSTPLLTSSSASVTAAPCLGGSSLASYTPSKLGEAEGWQPGITRHTPVNNSNNNTSNNVSSSLPSSDTNTAVDYLKPATPEQTVAWSEETAADLLF